MPTIEIQPEEATTWFSSAPPTTTDGADEYMLIANNTPRRTIFKFDFSAIPDGMKIDSATLSLYFWSQSGTVVGRTYMIRRITEIDWVQTQASWNNYSSGNAWASGGGDYSTDYQASAVMPSIPNWTTWDVQGIVATAYGAVAKIGHFIVMDADESGAYGQAIFHNLRYTTVPTLRPKLSITYSEIDFTLKAKPTKFYSGVKECFAKDGWSNKKNYFVEQSNPHPCVVQYLDLFVDTTNE